MQLRLLFFTIIFTFFSLAVFAGKGKVTGLPIPRFVTLKSSEVNMRTGPSNRYPIKWVYQRKSYPLEVIAEFGAWRKVQDMDKTQGWIHDALLTGRKNAVIINNKINSKSYKLRKKEMVLLRHPNNSAYPILRIGLGTIASVQKCNKKWCKVKISQQDGWIEKSNIWGVYKNEIIK